MYKYFAGGNTPFGFVSYFDNIFDYSRTGKLFILKGGSGVGKSTFMKEFAQKLLEKGFEIDYYYCSGDSDSVDAVFCQKLNIGMLDGTAPHDVNPIYPIVSEEIINLGQYVDSQKLQNVDEIKRLIDEKKAYYNKAYTTLSAIYQLDEAQRYLVDENIDRGKLIKFAHSFAKENLPNNPAKAGRLRKTFVSAYTPEGHINFENLFKENNKVMCTKCLTHHELAIFLKEIAELALVQGNDVFAFYNPLRPKEIDYIYFPQSDIVIGDFCAKFEKFQINLQSYIANFDDNQKSLFEQIEIEKERLFVLVFELLSKAKDLHKKLETYYVKAVEWSKLEIFKKMFFDRVEKEFFNN